MQLDIEFLASTEHGLNRDILGFQNKRLILEITIFIMFSLQQSGNVVAAVTSRADLVLLASNAVPNEIDVFEFRLDNLAKDLDEAETVAKNLKRPVLITARHPDEGGIGDLT